MSRTVSHMRIRYSKSRLISGLVREAPAVRRMMPMPSGTSRSCTTSFNRERSCADGFDEFLFGILAVVFFVVSVVAASSNLLVVGSGGIFVAGVLDVRHVVGVGRVLKCVFFVAPGVMGNLVMAFGRLGGRSQRL